MSGGFLKPVRGTSKAIRLYESLQASMAAELGADPQAVGGERLWRMPTSANVIYSNRKKYKLSTFRSWRDENRPSDMPGQGTGGKVYAFTKGLLRHPAIKELLQGVQRGQKGIEDRGRNTACFALAVAHLVSGYSVIETEQILLTWNDLNSPPMREQEVTKCVKSAAKGLQKDFLHYYNAMRKKIFIMTNIEIKYRPITPAKPRKERKRSHMDERKQDLIAHLQKWGGRKLTTLRRLAKELGMPLKTLKDVLAQLEDKGVIFRAAVGIGRRGFTVLILSTNYIHKCKKLMGYTDIHYGKARDNSNTSLTCVTYSRSYLQL